MYVRMLLSLSWCIYEILEYIRYILSVYIKYSYIIEQLVEENVNESTSMDEKSIYPQGLSHIWLVG